MKERIREVVSAVEEEVILGVALFPNAISIAYWAELVNRQGRYFFGTDL